MAKWTDFTTPTGAKGNLFDVKSIWGMVLGTVILLVTFSFGQRLSQNVHSKLPVIPSTPDAPFQPRVVTQTIAKEVI